MKTVRHAAGIIMMMLVISAAGNPGYAGERYRSRVRLVLQIAAMHGSPLEEVLIKPVNLH
jgi:hypothetical protein